MKAELRSPDGWIICLEAEPEQFKAIVKSFLDSKMAQAVAALVTK